jgi:hypothetical protein
VVTGGVGVSGAVYAAGLNGPLTGTVQTASQPNITSVGSLSSLTVTGFTGLGAAPAHTTGVQWQGFTGALELNGGVGSIGATTNGLYLQGNQFWDGSVGWSANALGASSQMLLGKGSINANVYASASANAAVGASLAGWNLSNTGFAITGGDLSHSSANPSAGVNLYIKNTTDTGGDNTRYAGIQFQIGSDVGTAAIQAYRTASASDYSTALAFLTKGSGAPATNPVERVRINSLGYMGIGTNNPSTTLHVVGASILANSNSINPDSYTNTVVAGGLSFPGGWGINSGIGGNAGTGNSWGMGHNGVNWYLGMGNGSASNTQQTYIQMLPNRNVSLVPTSGNVGIGTTTPGSLLTVNGSGASNIGVLSLLASSASTFTWASSALASNLTSGQNVIHMIGQANSSANAGYIGYKWSSSGSTTANLLTFGHFAYDNLMNLTAAGNLGIGTTSPAAVLDVSNAGSIYISNKNGAPVNSQTLPGSLVLTGYGWNTSVGSLPITGQISLGGQYGAISGGSTEPYLAFSLQGTGSGGYSAASGPNTLTERMRITNQYGYVGIGTTSPSYQLDVNGTVRAQGGFYGVGAFKAYSVGTPGSFYTFATISSATDHSCWFKMRIMAMENGAVSWYTFYGTAVIRHNGSPYGDFYAATATADANTQGSTSSGYVTFQLTNNGTTNGNLVLQAKNTTYGMVIYILEYQNSSGDSYWTWT